MKTLLVLSLLLLANIGLAAENCSAPPMSDKAKAMLHPLMQLRNRQATEQFFDDGRWRGESSVSQEVEDRVYRILGDRSKPGDEAVAYLLTVYMGEHPGEELVCEAASRGKRMLSVIRSYQHV